MKKSLWIVLLLVIACMFTLSACDESNDPQTPADDHVHTFSEWTTVKDSTCTVKGEQERSCSCGEKETQSIDALGHTEVIDVAVASTCTTDGKTEGKHCSVCSETLIVQNNIPASHTDGEWVVDTNATCTEDGSKHQVCSVCNASIKTEAIAATGHTDGEWVVDTNATCTEDGSKHQVCSVCNASIKTEAIAATGHTDGEWVTDADATCTVDGNKHQLCSVCSVTIKTEAITTKGHSYASEYDSGDCKNSAKIIFNCSKCGDNYSEIVNPISARIYKSSFSSINGYIYSATYTVIATGGYGQLQYKYEVLSSATNSTVILTGDYSTGTAFGFQSEYSLNKRVLRVTIKDIYGNETTYEILVGDDSFLVNGEIANQKSHNYVNDICTVCGEKYYSRGLKYTYLVDEDAYEVSSIGTCTDTKIYIPDTYENKAVISIAERAFDESNIKHLILGSNIKRIGKYAFSNCNALITVKLPESLASISDYAFINCHKLLVVYNNSSLTLQTNKTTNGWVAYYAKEIITDNSESSKLSVENDYVYYIDGNITYLIDYNGNSTIVQLPDTLNNNCYYIYKYALCNKNITYLVVSKGVLGIGEKAFDNSLSNLDSISVSSENAVYRGELNCLIVRDKNELLLGCNNSIIPNTVTSIAERAFYGCKTLKSVTIPNTIVSIGAYAFSSCSSLENIVFDDNCSLTTLASGVFSYCDAIKNIIIPKSIVSIGSYAFPDCDSLKTVVFEDGIQLTEIATSAFWGCDSLESIDIPNTVTTIGGFAFSNCYVLKTIHIPKNVTSIGNWAFYGCKLLTIHVEASEQPAGWHTDWNPTNCTVIWGYTL